MTLISSFVQCRLIGYSVVLGPVTGILLVDYFVIRRQRLNIDALYTSKSTGRYWYWGGWNPAAVVALIAGTLPTLPGLVGTLSGVTLAPLFAALYDVAWFVGIAVSSCIYFILMRQHMPPKSKLASAA
jgi:NCS1 family nucleobase:cation symporter-1